MNPIRVQVVYKAVKGVMRVRARCEKAAACQPKNDPFYMCEFCGHGLEGEGK